MIIHSIPPVDVEPSKILGAYRVGTTVHVMLKDDHRKELYQTDDQAHDRLVQILKAIGQAPLHEYS